MLDEIKGIGPKTIEALNKLNIYNIEDLVTYYPFRYNVYKPQDINNIFNDMEVVINGNIESLPRVYFIKKNLNKLSFKFNTSGKIINVTIFNRAFMKNNLKLNMPITLIGKYNEKTNLFTASDIKLKQILNEEIEPVYHLNFNIKKSNFKKILSEALNKNYYLEDSIPSYIKNKYDLMDKLSAVKIIHNQSNSVQIKKAKLTLVYDELFEFMLKINYLKLKKIVKPRKEKIFDNNKVLEFINTLPFTLTNDQVNTIEKIKEEINSNKKINRLILGDVGSGKTIVSFIALYMNFLSGYQGILMAPTEILAIQHYNNIKELFKNININIELITSSVTKKNKDLIIKKISNNEIDILIGTHSVLNDNLQFNRLGLVITDEQHRFGVNQRKLLEEKGSNVDVIYMSATPIPRTLALTIYGDMDISQIKTKPQERKEVTTKLYKYNELKEILNLMLDELKNNHQIYVVSPLIEEDEESNLKSVEELYEKMNIAFNNKVPIEILHGKLKAKEKDKIMDNFKSNKTKILISTTVIEVGIDIKNATMMVIFNAERFGLSTLHQLRGRIGRSNLESKCLLISDLDTQRLKVLEESSDGFYISEKDFEMRGSGDLFGVRQSGDMHFKIANLKTDYKILMQCKKDSEEFLTNHLFEINKYPKQKDILNSISFVD